MLVPQSAEYALRAMVVLAQRSAATALPVNVLAKRARVPRAYASKVMRQLVAAGLAAGRSGKRGGYWFTGDTRYVRVADILRAVGALERRGRCVLGQPRCDESNPCLMHPAWSALQAAYSQWANVTTLEAILQSGGEATPPGV